MEIITTPNPQKPTTKPTPTILFIAAMLAVTTLAGSVHAQSGNTASSIRDNADGIGMNKSAPLGSRTGVTATSTGTATSNDKDMNNMAPMAGANSFTEAQAQNRIGKAGFTNISGLTKGEDGIWRGSAMKNGSSHNVMLDFKGNVTVQ